jgi:23S rRNA pseudouridine2605 synthase
MNPRKSPSGDGKPFKKFIKPGAGAGKVSGGRKAEGRGEASGDRPPGRGRGDAKDFSPKDRPTRSSRPSTSREEKPVGPRESSRGRRGAAAVPDRYAKKAPDKKGGADKPFKKYEKRPNDEGKEAVRPRRKPSPFSVPKVKRDANDTTIRLNRFLSNAGVASRREADRLIELGLVSVNGKVVTELGIRVDPNKDVVKYDDVVLRPERLRYVMLNKPKDFLTTGDDPEGRKTVMWLVKDACHERLYPVGRLDRNTMGLLLFTNDGDLAKRLTNPKSGFPKLYHVETAEKIKGADLDKIREGLKLEDGIVKAEEVSLVNGSNYEVGIRINSAKNRVVHRIFEHFGYTIKKLDRVMYAGLTKKDLPRGRYRHLTEQEVSFLKMVR